MGNSLGLHVSRHLTPGISRGLQNTGYVASRGVGTNFHGGFFASIGFAIGLE